MKIKSHRLKYNSSIRRPAFSKDFYLERAQQYFVLFPFHISKGENHARTNPTP